jgi:D-serine deaminase-like pyridoxal phosphate-dependent protein
MLCPYVRLVTPEGGSMDRWARMTWEEYRDALAGRRLPAALVNLDAFEANVRSAAEYARRAGKTLRMASKSVRCPALLRAAFDAAPDVMKGIMAFTCEEAGFLASLGHDDFLVAYPSVQASDMAALVDLARAGKKAAIVVDCAEHVDALSAAAKAAGVELRACADLDVAYRPLGGRVHVGVRRSPVRAEGQVIDLVRYARKVGGVRIVGVMAYEAHVAGLPDANPFSRAMNPLRRAIKSVARPAVANLRERVARALATEGVTLDFFNGGGTGSLDWTPTDSAVTEVTAGSAFACSHLFSYFRGVRFLPAAFFALQAVRRSDPGYVTCQGGGYVASGEAGPDKLPVPYLPEGLTLVAMEGAGEVQTPLRLPPDAPPIRLGDPILFRHAKAGELAERFGEYLIVRAGKVVGAEPTYRGLGKAFL